MQRKIDAPFSEITNHILMPWAKQIAQAATIAHQRLTQPVLRNIVSLIPDAWFDAIPGGISASDRRAGYMHFFTQRLQASAAFEQEAINAHNRLI
jgi:hypothetical protein